MTKLTVWLLATLVAAALMSCASQKAPAEQAVAAAETSLAAIRETAQKYAPDQLQTVESQLGTMKDELAKGDYKAVLGAAPNMTSAINALKDAADTKKADAEAALAKAKDDWGPMSGDVPKMLDAIEKRVASLSKVHHLPKGVTKDSVASARSGMDAMKSKWSDASNAAAAGDYTSAVNQGQAVKSQADDVMKSLGMSPS